MTRKEAEAITGGLSDPGKMPGHGYSLPAEACRTGSKMRGVEGSVCSICYGRKGRYAFPSVRAALARRLSALEHPDWSEAMASLLGRDVARGGPWRWFRFHDSGDLQGPWHFDMLLALCGRVPRMRFWLPTLEVRTVAETRGLDGLPGNLCVRLSTPMIDGSPSPMALALAGRPGYTLSKTATRGADVEGWFECPAVKFKRNSCGRCRACWDRGVRGVVYYRH